MKKYILKINLAMTLILVSLSVQAAHVEFISNHVYIDESTGEETELSWRYVYEYFFINEYVAIQIGSVPYHLDADSEDEVSVYIDGFEVNSHDITFLNKDYGSLMLFKGLHDEPIYTFPRYETDDTTLADFNIQWNSEILEKKYGFITETQGICKDYDGGLTDFNQIIRIDEGHFLCFELNEYSTDIVFSNEYNEVLGTQQPISNAQIFGINPLSASRIDALNSDNNVFMRYDSLKEYLSDMRRMYRPYYATWRCGGFFISDKLFVTAAHCDDDQDQIRHFDGILETYFAVKNKWLHPGFNENTLEFDVMVIEIEEEHTGEVAVLSDVDYENQILDKYTLWNFVQSDRLNEKTMIKDKTTTTLKTEEVIGDWTKKGDSGGGLFIEGTNHIVGIVSSSYDYKNEGAAYRLSEGFVEFVINGYQEDGKVDTSSYQYKSDEFKQKPVSQIARDALGGSTENILMASLLILAFRRIRQ